MPRSRAATAARCRKRPVEQVHVVGRGALLRSEHGARPGGSAQRVVDVGERHDLHRAHGIEHGAHVDRGQVEQRPTAVGDRSPLVVQEPPAQGGGHRRPRRRSWRSRRGTPASSTRPRRGPPPSARRSRESWRARHPGGRPPAAPAPRRAPSRPRPTAVADAGLGLDRAPERTRHRPADPAARPPAARARPGSPPRRRRAAPARARPRVAPAAIRTRSPRPPAAPSACRGTCREPPGRAWPRLYNPARTDREGRAP